MRTNFFGTNFLNTPQAVRNIAPKFLEHPRFLSLKPKEDKLGGRARTFWSAPLRVEDPRPTGRSLDPKVKTFRRSYRAFAPGPTPLDPTPSEPILPDLFRTRWFWPDSDSKSAFSGPNPVKIGSKWFNHVRAEGLGGGRVQRGRSSWKGSVAPRKVLTKKFIFVLFFLPEFRIAWSVIRIARFGTSERRKVAAFLNRKVQMASFAASFAVDQSLKKREGVPEMGAKPLKALRGYRASNRASNRGSKGSRKTPEALRG